MKHIFVKGIVLSCLALLMTSCNTSQEKATGADLEQIKKEIQARENEFAEIYNTGELKKIGYYADDAVTFYQNMAPLTNKAERLEFLASDLNSNSNVISFKTNEVFATKYGAQVLEIGAYTVVDSTNTVISTGNYMSLFEKTRWQVCMP